jgi:NitT/TauT family transport system substrate-binding protein
LKMKKFFLSFFIYIFAILISGCSSKAISSNDVVNLRIAFFPNINHGQALIGKGQDRFKNSLGDKVNIEWKQFNSGTSEIEAIFAGAVDIGYIGPGPAVNGFIKSKGDIIIISGAADAGATFVSRSDLQLKNIKEDLIKKRLLYHLLVILRT